MAIELYVADTLSVSERLAVEVKRMQALGKELPKGFEIGGLLEEKVKQANGFSSRFEMLDELKKLGAEYSTDPGCFDYQYKILVPEEHAGKVIDVVKNAGYSIMVRPPEHHYMPAK